MESTLHHMLKQRYGTEAGGRSEVSMGGFRIDAVDESGVLIEIQSGSLGPLKGKLRRLLADHRVRVVKPVVLEKRIVRRARVDGPDLSIRRGPRRGMLVDVFDDLVGLGNVFPHPNLTIEVLAVSIDEVRLPRGRRPGYAIGDRILSRILGTTLLAGAGDLWSLLPPGCHTSQPFTTRELSARLDRPLAFAQRVAYCLRLAGATRMIGKTGNLNIYATPAPAAAAGARSARDPEAAALSPASPGPRSARIQNEHCSRMP